VVWWTLGARAARSRSEQLLILRALPDATALMAALVQTGVADSGTLRIVGAATPAPLGTRLDGVARALELGAWVSNTLNTSSAVLG
jgi:Flp pilus assembly protein TadB